MGAKDSPRWCDICRTYGDHHTDRHPDPSIDIIKEIDWIARQYGMRAHEITREEFVATLR